MPVSLSTSTGEIESTAEAFVKITQHKKTIAANMVTKIWPKLSFILANEFSS
jgi:hypothetical protein